MLSLKPGVRISGLRPELLIGIVAAERVFERAGADLVVTACVDGKHSAGSLHYAGQAVDLRTRVLEDEEERHAMTARIRECLGEDFDVVLEPDHIHLEFQPKRPLTN